jgi:hypothetical protein
VLCDGFFKKGGKIALSARKKTNFFGAAVQNAEKIQLHVKRIVEGATSRTRSGAMLF